jgi:hypothetical protein
MNCTNDYYIVLMNKQDLGERKMKKRILFFIENSVYQYVQQKM